MGKDVWKFISVSLVSLLLGVSPGCFLIGQNKPNINQVSDMISKEASLSIQQELKEIKLTQKSIEINMAKQSVQITQILEVVKK